MRPSLWILAGALCVLCGACATLGAPFSFRGPSSITVGKTTQSDLLAAYGQPSRVGYEDGGVKWAYGYYHYSLFGPAKIQELDVVFGKDGVVSSYTYEASNPAAQAAPLPSPADR